MLGEVEKAVARLLRDTVGGTPSVHQYLDVDESHEVAVFRSEGRPTASCTTYSTVGLYQAPNVMEGTDIPVELAMVSLSARADVPGVLASCAFLIAKDRWACGPGVVFPDVFTAYGDGGPLKHVMWVPPFPWTSLGAATVQGQAVHWLLGVPISEQERSYFEENGSDALEALLEHQDAQYFDLGRASVV